MTLDDRVEEADRRNAGRATGKLKPRLARTAPRESLEEFLARGGKVKKMVPGTAAGVSRPYEGVRAKGARPMKGRRS